MALEPEALQPILYEEYVGYEVKRIETSTVMATVVLVLDGVMTIAAGSSRVRAQAGEGFVAAPGCPPLRWRHPGAFTCLELSMPPWLTQAAFGLVLKATDGVVSMRSTEDGAHRWTQGRGAETLSTRGLDFFAEASVRAQRTTRSEIVWAFEQMRSAQGRTQVRDLADSVAWSRRYFTREFERSTGLTPKAALKLIRFHEAKRLLLETSKTLADVAAETGYADQSHLTRDVKCFSGMTPGAIRGARQSDLPGLCMQS